MPSPRYRTRPGASEGIPAGPLKGGRHPEEGTRDSDPGQYPAGRGRSMNFWGILALLAGILGMFGSFLFGLGILVAIPAVTFGFVGLNAAKKGLADNPSLNVAGLVLGFIGVALSTVFLVLFAFGFGFLWLLSGVETGH